MWFSTHLFTTMKRHAATRRVFWDLNTSEMHFRPDPLLGELTALPQTPSWWRRLAAPSPRTPTPALGFRLRISALRASGVHPPRQIPGYATWIGSALLTCSMSRPSSAVILCLSPHWALSSCWAVTGCMSLVTPVIVSRRLRSRTLSTVVRLPL